MKYTLNDLDKKLEAIQQESQKASDEPRQRLCQNYRKLVSRSKWVEFQQENHTCILNLLAYVDTLYEFAGDSDKGKKQGERRNKLIEKNRRYRRSLGLSVPKENDFYLFRPNDEKEIMGMLDKAEFEAAGGLAKNGAYPFLDVQDWYAKGGEPLIFTDKEVNDCVEELIKRLRDGSDEWAIRTRIELVEVEAKRERLEVTLANDFYPWTDQSQWPQKQKEVIGLKNRAYWLKKYERQIERLEKQNKEFLSQINEDGAAGYRGRGRGETFAKTLGIKLK